jgi:hypothetical protein
MMAAWHQDLRPTRFGHPEGYCYPVGEHSSLLLTRRPDGSWAADIALAPLERFLALDAEQAQRVAVAWARAVLRHGAATLADAR